MSSLHAYIYTMIHIGKKEMDLPMGSLDYILLQSYTSSNKLIQVRGCTK